MIIYILYKLYNPLSFHNFDFLMQIVIYNGFNSLKYTGFNKISEIS